MTVLNLKDVSLKIDDSVIVNNISLSVNTGEILAVVGPNGAGKSSLLKVMSGDLNASTGEIFLFGQALQKWDIQTLARKRAVLPQFSLLNFPYTVEEVVALGRSPHATGNDADNAIVNQCIDEFDLEHLRRRLYTQLSGGEKQRTQLARVLAQTFSADSEKTHNSLLILDEPGTALDLLHHQQLLQLLQKLAKQGLTVVLVVHDLNTAAKIADKILLMCCGQTMVFGTPEQVLKEAVLEQAFGAKISVIPHPDENRLLVIS